MGGIAPLWPVLVPSVLALQVGVFLLNTDCRATLNKLAFLACIAVAFWNLEGNRSSGLFPTSALYLVRLGGTFLPALCFHVLLLWSGQKRPLFFRFLTLAYGLAAFLAVLRPVVLSTIYSLMTGVFSLCLVVQQARTARGQERAGVLRVGLALTLALVFTTSILGLSFRNGHPFSPLVTAACFSYLAVLALTVTPGRFTSFGLYLRSSVVHSLGMASLAGIYVGGILLIAHFLQAHLRWNTFLIILCCILIAGPLFYPLKESLETSIRRFFPLPRDLYYEGLKHFLQEVNIFLPLPDLAGVIAARLASFLNLAAVCLLVKPSGNPAFIRTATVTRDSMSLGILVVPGHQEDLDLARLRQYSGLPLTEVYQLTGRNRTVGLLAISRHRDRTPLSREEHEVLKALTYQAGVAIENSELYAELLSVKDYYHTVMQSTANAVLIVNSSGLVVDVNRAAENLFGPAESLIGQPIEVATGQEALSAFTSQVIKSGCAVTGKELRFSRQGEELLPYAVNISPLLEFGHSRSPGALVALSDLSTIRSMERQVQRAERLAALGRLTAGLAHEIRNGLNNIGGYATMLADTISSSDPRSRFTRGILEDVTALEGMLSRFLSFAREEKLTSGAILLSDLVEKVLEALQPELRAHHIRLRTEFDPAAPPIEGDPSQLSQAITNVTLNAVEAMEAGGTLMVGVQRTSSGVELRVTDTGQGIPPEKQELVFEPFYTTKPNGTGLGLSITHSIITRHGGTIRIDSVPGLGTTVRIALPPISVKKETLPPEVDQMEADEPRGGSDIVCSHSR